MAFRRDPQILSGEGMAVNTMRLAGVPSGRVVTTENVDPVGSGFQVGRVDTSGVGAKVINRPALRDRPYHLLIDEPVRAHRPILAPEAAITPFALTALPMPTAVSLLNPSEESI